MNANATVFVIIQNHRKMVASAPTREAIDKAFDHLCHRYDAGWARKGWRKSTVLELVTCTSSDLTTARAAGLCPPGERVALPV